MILFVIWDVFSIAFVSYISLLLRFDGNIPTEYTSNMVHTVLPVVVCGVLVFYLFHLYKSLWEFAPPSLTEMRNIVLGSLVASLLNIAVCVMTDNQCQNQATSFSFDAYMQ